MIRMTCRNLVASDQNKKLFALAMIAPQMELQKYWQPDFRTGLFDLPFKSS